MGLKTENYSVVYKAIVGRKDGYSVTNALARRLQENPYISVSVFLKSLDKRDLEHLIDIGEKIKKEGLSSVKDINDAKEFVMISSMLVQGEGVDIPLNENTIPTIASRFFAFLNLEYLGRMGMVSVCYEHMSFDKDMDDMIIARRVI